MSGGRLPAGARANADSAAPAGFQGQDFIDAWQAAMAGRGAERTRRKTRPRRPEKIGGRAGMIRRPPPEPDGDDAA